MRNLASIQRIKKIEPIEGADMIELATVLGWHVVVAKKDNFKVGDLVVYCEIDSILPSDNPYFAFLEGKRIKTKRLRGVYSQGICFPTYILEGLNVNIEEGVDVTDALKVEKYVPTPPNDWYKHMGNDRPNKWYMRFAIGRWFWKKFLYKPKTGAFPNWINKTDQTRVQVLQDVLDAWKGTQCQYTEKIDGSSITFWLDDNDKLHVCSRNQEIFVKEHFFYQTAEKLIDNLKKTDRNTIFQGEIIGPNIQSNKYKLTTFKIYVFQASKAGEYFTPYEFTDLCNKCGLTQAPVLGELILGDDIDELVKLAEGTSKLAKIQREGIVIRPLENIKINDKRFIEDRISFKAINPKFLLKYDE